MAAKPLSKTKVVGQHRRESRHSEENRCLFFEELFKLAVKEAKGAAGKFVIPGIGRVVKAHRKARMAATHRPARRSRSRRRPLFACVRRRRLRRRPEVVAVSFEFRPPAA